LSDLVIESQNQQINKKQSERSGARYNNAPKRRSLLSMTCGGINQQIEDTEDS
jgi:hypothetical protein